MIFSKAVTCSVIVLLLFQTSCFLLRPQTAKAEFFEDFSNATAIASRSGLNLNTTNRTVKLAHFNPILSDASTTLFSHLATTTDITNPTIGRNGGGTTSNIAFSAGYSGDAINLSTTSASVLSFPGNYINTEKGSVSMWVKAEDWTKNITFFSMSGYDYNFYAWKNDGGGVWFYMVTDSGGRYGRSYFSGDNNTWHHFVFSWDSPSGIININIDGADSNYYWGSASGSAFPNSYNLAIGYHGVNFSTEATNVSFDELRISDELYGSADCPILYDADNDNYSVYLESSAFDTGVENPVWGNIEWKETLPAKTDIFIQTNVSSDNTAWDGWLKKGMVAFTFDDGYISHYTNARTILGQYGFPGTAYVITGALQMTPEQMHTLENEGWEIGCHGYEHLDVYGMDEATLRSNFGDKCATYLKNQGFNVRSMATPFGRAIGGVDKTILSDYFKYVRGYGGGPNTGSYPFGGPMSSNYWGYGTPANTATIDTVGANKEFAILTFHVIDPNDANLAPLAAYAYAASSSVDVVTFSKGMDRLSYQNPNGELVNRANKRYIKYRVRLYTYDTSVTPTLSSVIIREPVHIYKETTTTINASGVYTHSVWPKTTDTELNFTLAPSTSSVDVTIDSWSTTTRNNYYKKWRESATTSNIISAHSIGGFDISKYYQVKVDGAVLKNVQASATGSIVFTYSGGYAKKHVFEIEQANPNAPTIRPAKALSSTSIRWNFTDNASNETGFVLINTTEKIISTSSQPNLSYIDEAGLLGNTQYKRAIKSYNTAGYSASSSATSTYTLAGTPTGFNSVRYPKLLRLFVDTFPNSSIGSSGYLFWRTDKPVYNSGWIKTNTWDDSHMTESQIYSYAVKYRNSDGIETSTTTLERPRPK
ncbi:MAG: polysaccharide deacetylase family protein [Candidatus Gribaldobacteria bacterium]|nr:polysaccharide deacetylase family protein [Candidatus Gribaldobacteria bacterium]